MQATDAEFKKASDFIKVKKMAGLSNDQQLELYALFKQGTEGDNKRDKSKVSGQVEEAKYNAWMKKTGMKSEDAKKQYVELTKKHYKDYK